MNATLARDWRKPAIALVIVLLVGALVYLLRAVLAPVFAAFLIAYLLDPVVDKLESWRIPRGAGVGIVMVALLTGIALVILMIIPSLVRDVAGFVRELPQLAAKTMEKIEPWLAERGVAVPHSVDEALATLDINAQELASKAAVPVGAILGAVVGRAAGALSAFVGALLIPVLSAYLLYDFDRIKLAAHDLLPPRYRGAIEELAREVDDVLSAFIRGQVIIMAIMAALYAITYSAIGVRLAIPIGIIAGLLTFIPYVGGAIALGAALLMSVLDFSSGGWLQIGLVIGAYAIIQILEGFVITPRVLEGKVGLSAVWVLVALMAGGELFGFAGVLLAVPATAVLKIFVNRTLKAYRASDFFGAPVNPVETTAASSPPEHS